MTKAKKAEIEELKEIVRAVAPPGTTIYTILRRTTRSGMSHVISLWAFVPDKKGRLSPYCLDYHAAKILGWRLVSDGVMVKGYGSNMGFYLVERLCQEVYGPKVEVGVCAYTASRFDPAEKRAVWLQSWL